ncbi:Salicylate hydroxylase [Penicillium riverlandense]|uniref:Salicylate hydroxylase n=1 Tax=Penicillium riverlandense TaxID=1903569 RepID=UPI002547840C|nr:Salicylate hydroxylase [Penicillium riverlandense]KAJ5818913.1 Salicylate hydroxylase [Penicillium riverlandense]
MSSTDQQVNRKLQFRDAQTAEPDKVGSTCHPLDVLIVGCGLGGLSCAIECLRQGLSVTILEKAVELGEIGAGIQLPPNAVRVMDHFGLVPRLVDAGAINISQHCLLKYTDSTPVAVRPGAAWMKHHFGQIWYVIHRADYHKVLVKEAQRLGAKIRLNAEVVSVDFNDTSVQLTTQEKIHADVIIGADGLRSVVRDEILGYHIEPVETGDLAYRATIPKERVEALNEPFLQEPSLRAWVGPRQHAVLYPVRNSATFNLVLLCPDDLPAGVATSAGNVHEMRNLFKGWDPRLTALIAQVDNVLKWKICHMKELDTWCKNSVALLGDACHPSLPYQAQGAAMAVEDGAALGVFLGKLSREYPKQGGLDYRSKISDVLHLYESMRKASTTASVEGAIQNQILYHLEDGPEADARNKAFTTVDWDDPESNFEWGWGNLAYLKRLMAFNTMAGAEKSFDEWVATGEKH